MSKPLFDVSHLTPTEQVQFDDDLWASRADEPELLPLTGRQDEELDHRIEAYRKDPGAAIPWREALEIEQSDT